MRGPKSVVNIYIGQRSERRRELGVVLLLTGMAATFLKAKGMEVGDSLIEEDRVQFAEEFIRLAQSKSLDLLLRFASVPEAAGEPNRADLASLKDCWVWRT